MIAKAPLVSREGGGGGGGGGSEIIQSDSARAEIRHRYIQNTGVPPQSRHLQSS